MYKQKLTLDPKLAEICEATLYKERLKNSGCGVCALAMALSYMEGRNVTSAMIIFRGFTNDGDTFIVHWEKLLHILFLIKWKA